MGVCCVVGGGSDIHFWFGGWVAEGLSRPQNWITAGLGSYMVLYILFILDSLGSNIHFLLGGWVGKGPLNIVILDSVGWHLTKSLQVKVVIWLRATICLVGSGLEGQCIC